jgi:hypothetical protein
VVLRSCMTKYRIVPEIVEFQEGAETERGEKVYSTLEMTVFPPAANPIHRVIRAEKGIGFTEEWIEETVQGALDALKVDFPNDAYKVVRVKPNQIRLEYAGVTGMVQ